MIAHLKTKCWCTREISMHPGSYNREIFVALSSKTKIFNVYSSEGEPLPLYSTQQLRRFALVDIYELRGVRHYYYEEV